jgi:hypothetical protein
MPEFDYVLELLEAKGWYLYRGIPHAKMAEVIAQGKASSIEPNVFYHLLPATSHDKDVDEVHEAARYAARMHSMPIYKDGAKEWNIHGIDISGGNFNFVMTSDSIAFDSGARPNIERAIQFNLSSYNIFLFDSIDEVGSMLKERDVPQRPPEPPSQLRWTYVERDSEPAGVALYPENPGRMLFRGQTQRFVPCLPTAVRGIGIESQELREVSEPSQARLIVNLIRTSWFVQLLRETAAMQWLNEKSIFLNEAAVAQHYGLPTGTINLTQSFEVASFFACCSYDPARKSWTPAGDGEGVVYLVDWTALPPGGKIHPINLQAFPQASEQWGWACELRLGDDFDKLPFVVKLIFKQNLAASQRILAQFSEGTALFPEDPLAELAQAITAATVLPLAIAEELALDLISDPKGKPGATVEEIFALVQKFDGVTIAEGAAIPGWERINAALSALWDGKKEYFLSGAGFGGVRPAQES